MTDVNHRDLFGINPNYKEKRSADGTNLLQATFCDDLCPCFLSHAHISMLL